MKMSNKSTFVFAAVLLCTLTYVFLKIVQPFSGGSLSFDDASTLSNSKYHESTSSARKQKSETSGFFTNLFNTNEETKEEMNSVEYFRNTLVKTFDNSSLNTLADGLFKAIESGSAVPLLTLFTTWPDSESDAEHAHIRNLTMRNWASLLPFVVPVLITNSSQQAARAEMNDWHVIPVGRTAVGVPIFKDMYTDVMNRFQSTLYAYANGDILFTDTLLDTLLAVLMSPRLDRRPLLVAGRRTNLDNIMSTQLSTFQEITDAAHLRGKVDSKWGIDYFVTDRRFPWSCIPDLVIGRISYDNWLVGHAILEGRVMVVEATRTLLAVHPLPSAGVNEGKRRDHSNYNRDLLQRLQILKQKMKVTCSPFQTRFGAREEIEVQAVTMPTECGQPKR